MCSLMRRRLSPKTLLTLTILFITLTSCGRGDTASVSPEAYPAPDSGLAYPPPANAATSPAKMEVPSFHPHSLLNAPVSEVAQASLDYTHDRFPNQGTDPKVVLNRFVRAADLPALGFEGINFNPERPMALVILKGDFDVSSLARSNKRIQGAYIAYVFDLDTGVPTFIGTSRLGGNFRRALNDPTLPDDPTTVPDANPGNVTMVPMPTPIPLTNQLPLFFALLSPPTGTLANCQLLGMGSGRREAGRR